MPYVLIQDGVVVQKQPNEEAGFIDAPEDVICGYLYADGVFSPPDLASAATSQAVNTERDRRIDAGFMFLGYLFQNRPGDRENIAGAKSAATDAITMFHAEPGDLRWQRLIDANAPDKDFAFIAADNTHVPLDAYQTMQLGYTAMLNKQRLIFAGNALKAMNPIPADFADDRWWQ
jgi:hypothetical protein